jgi:hypothetical protein
MRESCYESYRDRRRSRWISRGYYISTETGEQGMCLAFDCNPSVSRSGSGRVRDWSLDDQFELSKLLFLARPAVFVVMRSVP